MVGQQVGERTIEELSTELGRIEPPAFPTVERCPWTACGICITKTGKRAARHAARLSSIESPIEPLP